MTATRSKVSSWKQQLDALKSLTQSNGVNAWKAAKIIRKLWKDKSFLNSYENLDAASAELQEYAGRFALSVSDMVQMIEHFPKQESWKGGRLDVLRDETAKQLLSKRRQAATKLANGRKSPERKNPIAYEVHKSLEVKYDKLVEKGRETEDEIGRLRAENSELREQLAKYQGRVEELERLLDKRFAK